MDALKKGFSRTMWATFTARGRIVWLLPTRREATACCSCITPFYSKVRTPFYSKVRVTVPARAVKRGAK